MNGDGTSSYCMKTRMIQTRFDLHATRLNLKFEKEFPPSCENADIGVQMDESVSLSPSSSTSTITPRTTVAPYINTPFLFALHSPSPFPSRMMNPDDSFSAVSVQSSL